VQRTCFDSVLIAWLYCSMAAVHAQDTVVPAKEEPRHRIKLENEVVRIVDVEIPPGDRTLMHEHSNNYAYLMVSAARLRNEVPGKPAADIDIAAGLVGYYRASQGAYVHRFSNIGESPFRAIGIELLSASAAPEVATPIDSATGYVTVLDNERVRAYRLLLQPGQSTGVVQLPPRTVRVAGSAANIVERGVDGGTRELKLTPAQFEWRAEAAALAVENTGSAPAELYQFELK